MSTTRWLRFAVDGLEVMVAAASFRRSLPAPAPLPETIEIGGDRYPVVDPRGPGGAAAGSPMPQLLLLFAEGGARVAVPASDVGGTFTADAGDLAPLPWPYRGDGWYAGVMVPARSSERPVLALDLAGLLRGAAAARPLPAEATR
ncbi:MAG TPA: hypothetical protein VHM02_15815 [Thermoanaerobaculia bacterium]|nr:hypothetical protein [Thermoanaerobaculia bacterium]